MVTNEGGIKSHMEQEGFQKSHSNKNDINSARLCERPGNRERDSSQRSHVLAQEEPGSIILVEVDEGVDPVFVQRGSL